MQHIGVFINPMYAKKEDIFSRLEKLAFRKDIALFGLPEQITFLPEYVSAYRGSTLNIILVFGGDGTVLRAINFSLLAKAPLLGVNLGKLGFLTDITLNELDKAIACLKENKYKIQNRMLIKISIRRKGKTIKSTLALNDAVAYKGLTSRLINVRIYYNGRFALETRCDGVIASTPTGSTAYSLSAGGPIIYPEMETIIVTPLNPHVLSVRPMVFSPREIIMFKITSSSEEAILQVDGENVFSLQEMDEIIIQAADQKIGFVKLTNKTFYQILRKKLHLGKL